MGRASLQLQNTIFHIVTTVGYALTKPTNLASKSKAMPLILLCCHSMIESGVGGMAVEVEHG